jgi:hypothetical protein
MDVFMGLSCRAELAVALATAIEHGRNEGHEEIAGELGEVLAYLLAGAG